MVFYDSRPLRRAGQVVIDLVVVVGVVASVVVGRAVSASISGVASIGTRVHDQGSLFREQLKQAATAIGRVPFAGDAVSRPFRDASTTAASIAAAGAQEHEQTIRLAHQVGTGSAVILILVFVAVWIRYRGGFIRRASETRRVDRSPGGADVLALRALVHRDASTALGPDVVGRWLQQDRDTVLALADVERRASGLPAR